MSEDDNFYKNAISLFLGEHFLNQLKADPINTLKLSGNEINATILSVDVASFSSSSTQLNASEVLTLLALYHEAMAKSIAKNNGNIEQLSGNYIQAYFIENNHAYSACKTALECMDEVDILNNKMNKPNFIKLMIGINSGSTIIGNIGSKYRMSYCLIGSTVNMANRFVSLNKHYKTSIIISDGTNNLLESQILTQFLDKVKIVGFETDINLYTLVGK